MFLSPILYIDWRKINNIKTISNCFSDPGDPECFLSSSRAAASQQQPDIGRAPGWVEDFPLHPPLTRAEARCFQPTSISQGWCAECLLTLKQFTDTVMGTPWAFFCLLSCYWSVCLSVPVLCRINFQFITLLLTFLHLQPKYKQRLHRNLADGLIPYLEQQWEPAGKITNLEWVSLQFTTRLGLVWLYDIGCSCSYSLVKSTKNSGKGTDPDHQSNFHGKSVPFYKGRLFNKPNCSRLELIGKFTTV